MMIHSKILGLNIRDILIKKKNIRDIPRTKAASDYFALIFVTPTHLKA